MDEYNEVTKKAGIFDFSLEGKIIVTGEGRINFINGIVSNDVEKLKDYEGCYACFLNKLGKVLSDCIVYKFPDLLLLNMNIMGKKNVIEMLKEEAPLGKSKMEDVSMKYALFSIQGPHSKKIIEKIFDSTIQSDNMYQLQKIRKNDQDILVTKNNRTAPGGFDLFVPASLYNDLKKKFKENNIPEISNETFEILRLEAKIPQFGVDFDQNNILPEVFQKPISYDKGCYVGQEIVIRIRDRAKGLTSKRLFHFQIDSEKIQNKKIIKNGIDAGYLTSSAFSPKLNKTLAFGYLKKEFFGHEKFEVNGATAIKSALQ